MIIIIGFVLLIAAGVFVYKMAEYSDWDFLGFVLAGLGVIGLITTLVLLPINYHSGKAEVERYHVLKETIKQSRDSENVSDVERAALTNEIAEYNKDLASTKYWNDTMLDIFIYDGLAELDYLE